MKVKTIGIAGGSGSGKSTLATKVSHTLGLDKTVIISHDSYYHSLDDLSLEARKKINYDHPDSLETDLLVKHLRELKKGKSVAIPEYDFKQFTRSKTTRTVEPVPYIIVEGILLFHFPELVDLLDLKIYIQVPPDERLIRRLQRDVKERGRTYEYGIEQYQKFTRPMHEAYVHSSRDACDIYLYEGGEDPRVLTLIRQSV